jgi:polyisoprenoid-binding protein YceI
MLRSMRNHSQGRRRCRQSHARLCAGLLAALLVWATPTVAVEPCQPFEGGRVDAQLLKLMRDAARHGRLYRVVPGNSRVGFCVRHFPMQEFRGEFTNIVGGLALPSADNLDYGQALLLIHTSPLDVSDESLAPLVKGHNFMDIRHYPEIIFAGHTFEWLGPMQGYMYGDLTLRGRTQGVVFKVSIDVTEPGTGELPGRILLRGTGQVSRYRFDMRSNSLTVSETVRLCLAVEMVRWGS